MEDIDASLKKKVVFWRSYLGGSVCRLEGRGNILPEAWPRCFLGRGQVPFGRDYSGTTSTIYSAGRHKRIPGY